MRPHGTKFNVTRDGAARAPVTLEIPESNFPFVLIKTPRCNGRRHQLQPDHIEPVPGDDRTAARQSGARQGDPVHRGGRAGPLQVSRIPFRPQLVSAHYAGIA